MENVVITNDIQPQYMLEQCHLGGDNIGLLDLGHCMLISCSTDIKMKLNGTVTKVFTYLAKTIFEKRIKHKWFTMIFFSYKGNYAFNWILLNNIAQHSLP